MVLEWAPLVYCWAPFPKMCFFGAPYGVTMSSYGVRMGSYMKIVYVELPMV